MQNPAIDLVVIPARGGSKGIPKKNLRVVNGLSLLERAIRAALSVKGVYRDIVVSSDCEETLGNASKFPVLLHCRSAETSTDQSTTKESLREIVSWYEKRGQLTIKSIMLFEPTSPFRPPESILRAVKTFNAGVANTLITLKRVKNNPHNIFDVSKDGSISRYIESPKDSYSQRQQMASLRAVSGEIYIFKRENIFSRGTLLRDPICYEEVDGGISINIDCYSDLSIADYLARTVYDPLHRGFE